jgi:60 kDa SS-A/Ro ribonucleoprotein
VHPVSVLLAAKTYAAGHSLRGDSVWAPVPKVIDALDAAFYAAYEAVEPAGKRTMVALDVSGSMGSQAGGLPLSCREATAALALVTANTEPQTLITGFTRHLSVLSISPRQRLDDAVRSISGLPFGSTDCAAPMAWAMANNVAIDTFLVATDNETWAGSMHPHQALELYRQRTGIPARLAVAAMTPTEFTIADPDDPGSMDVSGFDSAVPTLLADFSRGDV